MRKEETRLAKVDRQRRAAERRLQASHPDHPNRVEDSMPRGSESTTGSDSGPRGSAPTSSEPIGSEPDYHIEKPNYPIFDSREEIDSEEVKEEGEGGEGCVDYEEESAASEEKDGEDLAASPQQRAHRQRINRRRTMKTVATL